jgi:hypothetical protein
MIPAVHATEFQKRHDFLLVDFIEYQFLANSQTAHRSISLKYLLNIFNLQHGMNRDATRL